MNTITVLTDFGLKDPYSGIMKGVIFSINPHARVVDVTHEVEAQDVREAAFLVPEYYPFFPKGTVHLCVVDPGVGSVRKPLIARMGDHLFVGPDNGLFSLILQAGATAHEITNRRFMLEHVSGTFHGRDIFAPAAAYLSAGTEPTEFGPAVKSPVILPGLFPSVRDDVMAGHIVRFDRFGNAITNVTHEQFNAFAGNETYSIDVADLSFDSLSKSYYENEYTCMVGSSGYLEFGRFRGNFAESKGIRKGYPVTIRRKTV